MRLSWQPGFSLSRKPARRPTVRRVKRGPSGDGERAQHFEFILENPTRGHGAVDSESATNITHPATPVEPITDGRVRPDYRGDRHFHPLTPGQNGTQSQGEGIEQVIINDETLLEPLGNEPSLFQSEIFPDLGAVDRTPELRQYPCNNNEEFCKIPLTTELRINPFQYRENLEPEPTFLVHAVMALAGHHVESTSAQDHRLAAFQLLRDKLGSYTNAGDVYAMLDTVIILFSLDETQSAFGNWNTHLMGAYGLLEACGGIELARLCAEKRKSSSIQYATFDTTAILEIEQSLETWYHTSSQAAFQDEESMQQDQDSMHCSEAWRNGLLIYIYRVFRWELGSNIPMPILFRARAITDHVFACRDKRCELRDRPLRRKIVKFCSIWDSRTRYHMFSNTIPLLEEVWAEQSAKGFENVWWGQIVDKQHSSQAHHTLQMRLCFG
ncbi:hypothetical protein MGYG_06554 [Nannizzia gypsea CBS 118893]|uniref:Uncharacterized protein n=1 Tax=Arthroderma gypseum (strain ATCC MYA-4604 / CBS 118893) TaxID=535722 RepID=E4UZM8_ARTGP|nr:hypothetical protein MGYG_06554 [Nannizzia gypsea CBS 118893]EFR03558.1 hypothetical protein MGYG_06554 [Nannizzia gypsea CBS 118893]